MADTGEPWFLYVMAGISLVGIGTVATWIGSYGGNNGEVLPVPDDIEMPAVQDGPPENINAISNGWLCVYKPTFNENWHDDVLCRNGDEYHRPYLLPDNSFVTEDEIMAAAKEYERRLNATSDPSASKAPNWRDYSKYPSD